VCRQLFERGESLPDSSGDSTEGGEIFGVNNGIVIGTISGVLSAFFGFGCSETAVALMKRCVYFKAWARTKSCKVLIDT